MLKFAGLSKGHSYQMRQRQPSADIPTLFRNKMISFIVPFATRPTRTSGLCHHNGRCKIRRHANLSQVLCVAGGTVAQDVDGTPGILSPTFPERASGEWFGYEAAFSARTGAALNIEERFVPDEFREWNVEIKGFDTVTSTQVTAAIYQKRTRALPAVGCEADAVTPETATCIYENIFGFQDGSFCAGPFRLSEPCDWSFTLVDPHDDQNRARIEFGRIDYGDAETGGIGWGNGRITVFIERREADFCDGQVLPGCGGSGGFASEEATDLGDLDGTWSISSEAFSGENSWHSLETSLTSTRDSDSLQQLISTALPRGLSVEVGRSNSSLNVVVGWLRGNRRVVLRRVYDAQGTLLSVSRELETRRE